VLLVNDTPELRRLKSLVLQGAGYSVAEVLDGEVALSYLRESTSSLVVVMSTRIPSLDAAGILRAVATDLLLRRHAYVLTTALASQLPDALVQLVYHLRVEVISKPFSPADLLAAISRASQRLQEEYD
jgi:CheY-like chemotaxis protein